MWGKIPLLVWTKNSNEEMRWYWLKCVQRLLLNSAQLEHWLIKIINKFKEGAVEKEVQWSKTVAQNPAFTTYCNQSLFPCLKLKCRKFPKYTRKHRIAPMKDYLLFAFVWKYLENRYESQLSTKGYQWI